VPNNEAQLWRRGGGRERSIDRIDPVYVETRDVLLKSKKFGQMVERPDGSYSDVVPFSSPTEDNKSRHLYAEAHLSKKDDQIRIAIAEGFDRNKKPVNLRSFQMTPQGKIINLDIMDDLDPVTSADDLADITRGLRAVRERELRDIAQKRERIERIRTGFGRGAVALIVGGGLAAGVFAGLKAWVFDPAEAADAYREEFNQTDYSLPGEGIELDYHDFDTIPADEFDDIPSYGGIDQNLSSPRTFEISTEGCVSINTEVSAGDDLIVALADNSPYVGYHFETSLETDGFAVCLTEDSPLETGDTVEIAVQVR
jgi:hypothetical protein